MDHPVSAAAQAGREEIARITDFHIRAGNWDNYLGWIGQDAKLRELGDSVARRLRVLEC